MNTEIISVGTELLLGHTVNTDARDISEGLAELGINVFWHTVVGDNPARLTECVYRAMNRADLIITTGGLGPTCDDLTKQVLARSFDRELYFDERAAADLRRWFEERGRTMTENNLRQAWLPEGCQVLPNDCGTAPGCIFRQGNVRVVMLPGPPRECNTMFRRYVVPYLRQLSGEIICSHTVRMFGIGESAMEAKLRDLMDAANPTVAPYSREGECWVRITAKGASKAVCESLMEPVLWEVQHRMGDFVYGIDCENLEERVSELLHKKQMTLSAAESCTGGLLAKRLTDIPGASSIFRGGVTVYTESAKTRLLDIEQDFIDQNGVVSVDVAGRMAKRVRALLHSNLGIGITGWAGPDGENVGLVYVALATETDCFVRKLKLGATTPRSRIRLLAANNALDMVRRYLTGREI